MHRALESRLARKAAKPDYWTNAVTIIVWIYGGIWLLFAVLSFTDLGEMRTHIELGRAGECWNTRNFFNYVVSLIYFCIATLSVFLVGLGLLKCKHPTLALTALVAPFVVLRVLAILTGAECADNP